MKLSIVHQTRYQYGAVVESSHHLSHLMPINRPNQQVIQHTLNISPQSQGFSARTDAFGNTVTQWHMPFSHDHLQVTTRSEIKTFTLPKINGTITCEESARFFQFVGQMPASPASKFVYPSPHVPTVPAIQKDALTDLCAQRPLIESAIAYMKRLHAQLVYDNLSTHVDTPVQVAWQNQRGVCQDFAHIMLAGLRGNGMAACYVSGYLLTQPAPGQLRVIGGDASHAWVALYVPGLDHHPSRGWLHLDPTNQRHGWGSPGEDYVVLAMGRDFSDVSPLRGILRGGDASAPQVDVAVEMLDGD